MNGLELFLAIFFGVFCSVWALVISMYKLGVIGVGKRLESIDVVINQGDSDE